MIPETEIGSGCRGNPGRKSKEQIPSRGWRREAGHKDWGSVSEVRVWGHGASATPPPDGRGHCQTVLGGGNQGQKMGAGLRMQQLLHEHLNMDHSTRASRDAVSHSRASPSVLVGH